VCEGPDESEVVETNSNGKYECSKCGREFSYLGARNNVHVQDSNAIWCDCDFTLTDVSSLLAQHQAKCTGEPPSSSKAAGSKAAGSKVVVKGQSKRKAPVVDASSSSTDLASQLYASPLSMDAPYLTNSLRCCTVVSALMSPMSPRG